MFFVENGITIVKSTQTADVYKVYVSHQAAPRSCSCLQWKTTNNHIQVRKGMRPTVHVPHRNEGGDLPVLDGNAPYFSLKCIIIGFVKCALTFICFSVWCCQTPLSTHEEQSCVLLSMSPFYNTTDSMMIFRCEGVLKLGDENIMQSSAMHVIKVFQLWT